MNAANQALLQKLTVLLSSLSRADEVGRAARESAAKIKAAAKRGDTAAKAAWNTLSALYWKKDPSAWIKVEAFYAKLLANEPKALGHFRNVQALAKAPGPRQDDAKKVLHTLKAIHNHRKKSVWYPGAPRIAGYPMPHRNLPGIVIGGPFDQPGLAPPGLFPPGLIPPGLGVPGGFPQPGQPFPGGFPQPGQPIPQLPPGLNPFPQPGAQVLPPGFNPFPGGFGPLPPSQPPSPFPPPLFPGGFPQPGQFIPAGFLQSPEGQALGNFLPPSQPPSPFPPPLFPSQFNPGQFIPAGFLQSPEAQALGGAFPGFPGGQVPGFPPPGQIPGLLAQVPGLGNLIQLTPQSIGGLMSMIAQARAMPGGGGLQTSSFVAPSLSAATLASDLQNLAQAGVAMAASSPELAALRNLGNDAFKAGFDIGSAISKGSNTPGPGQMKALAALTDPDMRAGFLAAREKQYQITGLPVTSARPGGAIAPAGSTVFTTVPVPFGIISNRQRAEAAAAAAAAEAAAIAARPTLALGPTRTSSTLSIWMSRPESRDIVARTRNPAFLQGFDLGTATSKGNDQAGPGQDAVLNRITDADMRAGFLQARGLEYARTRAHIS